MVSQEPYSKVRFWQILLVSFVLVNLCQLSCAGDALPENEDDTKTEKRDAPLDDSAEGRSTPFYIQYY